MARDIPCDFCGQEIADMLVTRIGDGQTVGVGKGCMAGFLAQTAQAYGLIDENGYPNTDDEISEIESSDDSPMISCPSCGKPYDVIANTEPENLETKCPHCGHVLVDL